MHYRAKLLFGQIESTADGKTEQEAIDIALADSVSVRTAASKNPDEVALVMFQVDLGQRQPQHVSYATTLGKYNQATA